MMVHVFKFNLIVLCAHIAANNVQRMYYYYYYYILLNLLISPSG